MTIVGSSILTYFYPTLVEGLGYKGNRAQYMTVPIFAVAFVCNALTGYFSDKLPKYRGIVIASWLTLSMSCSIAVCAVYQFKIRHVLLVLMAAGLGRRTRFPFLTPSPVWEPRSVGSGLLVWLLSILWGTWRRFTGHICFQARMRRST